MWRSHVSLGLKNNRVNFKNIRIFKQSQKPAEFIYKDSIG